MLIAAGVALQVWVSGSARADRRYALQLPAVLMYSLASALFLFSIFPDSLSEGRALGFGIGGAAGFSAFFMLASFSWLSQTRPRDQMAAELKATLKENARLRRQLNGRAVVAEAPVPLAGTSRYEVQLPSARRHHLGMITGNLANVLGVDVWVNPENTRMEMSRITEHTVSATIRYHGSRRNTLGHVVDDTIALELAGLMSGQTQVAAGHVLVTGAGELCASHQVQRIVHVAAVEGEPASGFRQVMDLERCVRNILTTVDRLNSEGDVLRSVVLPLLGTGGGNSDLRATVASLVASAVAYFEAHRGSDIRTVYLLAYTDVQAAVCREVLELRLESIDPTGG
ncbi:MULTISPECIES: macro domain-containing protein [unclassified Streptomyces]|uniref:macro domain-containing protein n=1 Tax=unclassified Streptomyces TaxID=2593676 RepID=UPI002E3492DD|nr:MULTISPECIES: macro domain-containing protein [unclassified Streptomyces]